MAHIVTRNVWHPSQALPVDFTAARVLSWALPIRLQLDGSNPETARYKVYFESELHREIGDHIIGCLGYAEVILREQGRLLTHEQARERRAEQMQNFPQAAD